MICYKDVNIFCTHFGYVPLAGYMKVSLTVVKFIVDAGCVHDKVVSVKEEKDTGGQKILSMNISKYYIFCY